MLMDKIVGLDGFVTHWTLNAHIDAEPFSTKMTDLGLGAFLPELMTPFTVLWAALNEVVISRELMFRSLAHKAGFEILREKQDVDLNTYEKQSTVHLNITGERPRLVFNGATKEFIADVEKAYAAFNGQMHTLMLSHSLARVVDYLKGHALRPEGGVFWVPSSGIETWKAVGQIIADTNPGNTVFLVSHHFEPNSTKAVHKSLWDSIENDLNEIWVSIRSGEELPERQRKQRKAKISKVRNKIIAASEAVRGTSEKLLQAVDSIERAEATSVLID